MCTRVARVHACAAELGGTVWTRVRVLREDPIWFVAPGGVRDPVWWPIRGLSVAYPWPIRGLSLLQCALTAWPFLALGPLLPLTPYRAGASAAVPDADAGIVRAGEDDLARLSVHTRVEPRNISAPAVSSRAVAGPHTGHGRPTFSGKTAVLTSSEWPASRLVRTSRFRSYVYMQLSLDPTRTSAESGENATEKRPAARCEPKSSGRWTFQSPWMEHRYAADDDRVVYTIHRRSPE